MEGKKGENISRDWFLGDRGRKLTMKFHTFPRNAGGEPE